MNPTRLAPRDFDLSPFFEIIKFNAIEPGGFDYELIQWAESLVEESEEVA